MSRSLNPLYHWSPKANRTSILQHGLQVMSEIPGQDYTFPWICLGTSPAVAWNLLPPDLVEPDSEVVESGFDLWQVRLSDSDHLSIRDDFGAELREVRVQNSIPGDRIWWVGERYLSAHESIEPRFVQVRNPKTDSWIKIDREKGLIVDYSETEFLDGTMILGWDAEDKS